jgi:prevent-host-death family protein
MLGSNVATVSVPMQMTSREFNQDTARAKREAVQAPVIITDRGRPTHVLLTVEAYERLAKPRQSILDMLHDPASAHIDLPLPERRIEPMREIDWGQDR